MPRFEFPVLPSIMFWYCHLWRRSSLSGSCPTLRKNSSWARSWAHLALPVGTLDPGRGEPMGDSDEERVLAILLRDDSSMKNLVISIRSAVSTSRHGVKVQTSKPDVWNTWDLSPSPHNAGL